MAQTASDRLLSKVEPFMGDSIGVGMEQIGKMPLTADVVADIFECLRSRELSELKWGLWFGQGVLDSKPPRELLVFLVAQLHEWIIHENEDIRETALPLLVRLRENFADYRSIMLKCLKDANPEVRRTALAEFKTFLTAKDIPVLLEFKDDEYMSETSMNSPLIYAIRNQALAVIEQLCGQKFPKHENVSALEDGHTVYWWDWKPFLDWWAKNQRKRKWRFWKK